MVLALVAGGWLAFRASQVKSALQDARTGLTTAVDGLSGGDVGALRAAQRAASSDVSSARRAVDDPLWRLAGWVPVAGRSFAVTREATLVVEQVVDGVLPPLLEGAMTLQDGELLKGGRIDLGLLGALSVGVTDAEAVARAARADARAIPEGSVPAQLADARGEL
ncbi:MAG: hypothetical protein JWN88_1956, partial [Frankiales bacterium]|nr:hypothetical protein [Frankiales bacterium]